MYNIRMDVDSLKPGNKMLRVALVSDQPIYLRGLSSLVLSTPQTHLVGEARSAVEALQLCDLTRPDLFVLDLNSSQGRTREVIKAIRQRLPDGKIVLLQETHENGEEPDIFQFSREIGEDEFKAALEQLRRNLVPRPAISGHAAEEDELPPPPIRAPLSGSQLIPYRNQELLTRELVMAGRIQADILPEEAPIIPGWDVAAVLQPARETSGDFYDFMPLSVHKWGLVVADVTDKGMGAALLMALTSTLMRTYAARFPTLPAFTLSTVSERILSDTRGGMFVTAFFGILETHTGRFIFANAGHPPGYLISLKKGRETVDRLVRTGMALGVSEDARWKQKSLRLEPGDVLVVYTDGITEAADQTGKSFGEERLLEVILARSRARAEEICSAVLEEVRRFTGSSPRQDDIALVVIKRDS
jgi:DNA-binding NarL/FixJ family response regulator